MSNPIPMDPHAWSHRAFRFACDNLPNILQACGEGNETQALETLVEKWKEHRGAVEMADRKPEIAANRAEVDAKLETRAAAEAPKKKNP